MKKQRKVLKLVKTDVVRLDPRKLDQVKGGLVIREFTQGTGGGSAGDPPTTNG